MAIFRRMHRGYVAAMLRSKWVYGQLRAELERAGSAMHRQMHYVSHGYESTDAPCSEPHLAEGHWDMKPVATQDFPDFTLDDREHLQKYDPDANSMTLGDEPWLRECLTDPNYSAPGNKKQ
jgi:hypothetical protein